jgi:hypothetical protein
LKGEKLTMPEKLETLPPMSAEEYEKAIQELRDLRKQHKICHPSWRESIQKKYDAKLHKLAGDTHMLEEDIESYL